MGKVLTKYIKIESWSAKMNKYPKIGSSWTRGRKQLIKHGLYHFLYLSFFLNAVKSLQINGHIVTFILYFFVYIKLYKLCFEMNYEEMFIVICIVSVIGSKGKPL